jgi:hypothetical protein
MRVPPILLAAVALGFCSMTATALGAGGQTRLDLVGADQSAALAFQEWLQVLTKAGIKNVRIRSGDITDKIGIEVQGTDKSPLYVVTGFIVNRNELLLPSGRYTRGDVAQLARWLDEVAKEGPPDRRPKRTVFGLTTEQFAQVHEDLSLSVGFETKGMTQTETVEKIRRKLHIPLGNNAQWKQAAGGEVVDEELSKLSCGTALACVLRYAGFCLAPVESSGKLAYSIVKDKQKLEAWPIGLEPSKEKPSTKLAPALFELRNVNVENVPVSKVLEAIGEKVSLPILLDRNAIARRDSNPTETLVSLPQRRISYNEALKILLFKVELKFEVRVDEAGNAFIWVSTIEPVR